MLRRITFVLLLLAAGCNLSRGKPALSPTLPATALAPTLEVGWFSIAQGIETRSIKVEQPYTSLPFEMMIVRIDPTQVIFRVQYVPQQWSYMHEWAERLNDPLVVVNANFFDHNGEAVGLVVADGQRYGYSFEGFGGMLQIDKDTVRLRSLRQEPYQGEILTQAVQGFPMLVDHGGVPARTGDGFDDPSRRTIIAQDSHGRILLMITPFGTITFRNAQKWLLESNLDIQIAFGLDGGKSSGLLVKTPQDRLIYNSIDPVPVVLAVYSR